MSSAQAGGEVAASAGALFLEHDVADEATWERVIEAVLRQHGQLDLLVNNAGISMAAPVTDMTLAQWRTLMAINLDGAFLGTKHAVRAMRARRGRPHRQRLVGVGARRRADGERLLRRMAAPEEIAEAILHLASDAAAFMTGSELVIDGGYTAG